MAIYANEDRFALHRFKADESYLVGTGQKPIAAYLDIADIIRVAKGAGVDAINPGYGFLSETPEFDQACAAVGSAGDSLSVDLDAARAEAAIAIAARSPTLNSPRG